jgi:RNA polymerase sigma factor (sigma-70 family)
MQDQFEQARPRLMGLAYRILGSVAEAEDAVQDTSLKWLAADQSSIANPAAWLTTVCTRRCLDVLKSAQHARVDYVGTWLPEPLHTQTGEVSPEDALDLAGSLSTAFLLLLERLTPKERAAYLLHEIFDRPYEEIGSALSVSEPACRKLVSRARASVSAGKQRFAPSPENQKGLLQAFQAAISTGDTAELSSLLSTDVQLAADGGGKVIAARSIIYGKDKVLRFIERALCVAWGDDGTAFNELNGQHALVYGDLSAPTSTVSFELGEKGKIERIYIMRNPDKLAAIQKGAISVV